jgi:hypothetical protein
VENLIPFERDIEMEALDALVASAKDYAGDC